MWPSHEVDGGGAGMGWGSHGGGRAEGWWVAVYTLHNVLLKQVSDHWQVGYFSFLHEKLTHPHHLIPPIYTHTHTPFSLSVSLQHAKVHTQAHIHITNTHRAANESNESDFVICRNNKLL